MIFIQIIHFPLKSLKKKNEFWNETQNEPVYHWTA